MSLQISGRTSVESADNLPVSGCGMRTFDPTRNGDTISFMQAEPTLTETITWLIFAATALGGFIWAVTHGQFTDLERAARLPLEDDNDEPRR